MIKQKSIQTVLSHWIDDRITEMEYKENKMNEQHTEALEELVSLKEKLYKTFTKEQWDLFEELETVSAYFELLRERAAYIQGVKDKDLVSEELKAVGLDLSN